jgi:hypothetical protein
MALAIVVDDRIDVWEPGVLEQIVVASPFNHYPTAASSALGEGPGNSKRGHDEIARILNYLRGIRKDLFHFWDNCLGPTVRCLLERGVPNAFWALDMHALLSASPFVNVNSMAPNAPLPLAPTATASMCASPLISDPLPLLKHCSVRASSRRVVWSTRASLSSMPANP